MGYVLRSLCKHYFQWLRGKSLRVSSRLDPEAVPSGSFRRVFCSETGAHGFFPPFLLMTDDCWEKFPCGGGLVGRRGVCILLAFDIDEAVFLPKNVEAKCNAITARRCPSWSHSPVSLRCLVRSRHCLSFSVFLKLTLWVENGAVLSVSQQ